MGGCGQPPSFIPPGKMLRGCCTSRPQPRGLHKAAAAYYVPAAVAAARRGAAPPLPPSVAAAAASVAAVTTSGARTRVDGEMGGEMEAVTTQAGTMDAVVDAAEVRSAREAATAAAAAGDAVQAELAEALRIDAEAAQVIEAPTRMKLRRADGQFKHRRWFWADVGLGTISWAKDLNVAVGLSGGGAAAAGRKSRTVVGVMPESPAGHPLGMTICTATPCHHHDGAGTGAAYTTYREAEPVVVVAEDAIKREVWLRALAAMGRRLVALEDEDIAALVPPSRKTGPVRGGGGARLA
eukprot:COSAG01_NODE_587_length_15149_cov_13.592558_13_plen_295_part_00